MALTDTTTENAGRGTEKGERLSRVQKKVRKGNLHDDLSEQEGDTGDQEELSFKDKLLSNDSMQGSKDNRGSRVFDVAWIEYIAGLKSFFHKDLGDGSEEEDQDDKDCPTLKVSQEEYELWCMPWRKSLIIKLLGKTIPIWAMRNSLARIWETNKPFTIGDIDDGFFVVSFEDKSNMNQVYQEGPWMIADRYLVVQ